MNSLNINKLKRTPKDLKELTDDIVELGVKYPDAIRVMIKDYMAQKFGAALLRAGKNEQDECYLLTLWETISR